MGIGKGTSHTGVCWGCGARGGITLGEMPVVGERGMETANHHGVCVSMQQSCKIYTCTPEIKVQLKKKFKKIQKLARHSGTYL